MKELGSFCFSCRNFIDSNDGARLGAALRLVHLTVGERGMFLSRLSDQDVHRAVVQNLNFNNNQIESAYAPIIEKHLKSFGRSHANDHAKAYEIEKEAAMAFQDLMSKYQDETNWWLPALNAIVLRLRLCAYAADEATKDKNRAYEFCIDAVNLLQAFLRNMIQSRASEDVSRKMGCLFVVNHMFKLYFKINNLRLATNLVKTASGPSFPNLTFFLESDIVTYKYYFGRLRIFEEDYKSAEEALEYAFLNCHKRSRANKRRILEFLIPVKMLLGKLPLKRTLEVYNLRQFEGIVRALRSGDFSEFNQQLEQQEDYFIAKGIFLILEKLKTYVYRNLFKKIYNVYLKTIERDGKLEYRLLLDTLQVGLRLNGVAMDHDELECVLANLIYGGYIKGYIAHGRAVVLSKKDAFPKLSLVI